MINKKITITTVLVAGALTLGALAPLIPVDDSEQVSWAISHRQYLQEREVYMNSQKEIQNIPTKSIEKATVAREKFENYLVKEKLTTKKDRKIKSKNESIVEKLSKIDSINRAYAYVFGLEDFESCGSIPCAFTSDGSYGSGAFALDATSKVNGTDSARCDVGGSDSGCVLTKTVTSGSTYYIQMTVFLPTGWSLGVSGYTALWTSGDGSGAPVYCNLEDYGSVRLTCGGDELGYTDTSINIALNTVTKLEFRIKISTSAGDVDIWQNNNTEGSPTYNGSGSLNTGSQNITSFSIGGYNPDVVNDRYYDDVVADTSFIGDTTTSVVRRIIMIN